LWRGVDAGGLQAVQSVLQTQSCSPFHNLDGDLFRLPAPGVLMGFFALKLEQVDGAAPTRLLMLSV
jgi:hypothetical protein